MVNCRKQVKHQCVRCGKTFPHQYILFCDHCGAMIDTYYDLTKATLHQSENSLIRFFDLLPLEDIDSIRIDIPATPAHHAKRLGKWLGIDSLYLKDETVLPTGTTKDRMAAVVLPFMLECGVNHFATSSTGNSSTSLAYYIKHYTEVEVNLFSGEDFKDRVQFADHPQVSHYVLKGGTFVDAFRYAGEFAQQHQITAEQGFFNPARREGLKVAFLEATEQIPTPIDWYVQAVSSAMGVYGVFKGAKELLALKKISQLPRVLAIQQESCAPMVKAFNTGSATIRPQDIIEKPKGIATAILRGDPSRTYPYVREIILESNGQMVAVSEAEIRQAHIILFEMEGIDCCFTAAAAVAGVIKQIRSGKISPQATIMINLTGRHRKKQGSGIRDQGSG